MTNRSHKKDPDFEGFDDELFESEAKEDEGGEGSSTEKVALTHPAYEELLGQLSAAEAKANEHWENLLRLNAELENMRRRNERDVAQAHKFGLEKFAQELLPVVDNLERGLAQMNSTETSPLRTGVELTLKQLQAVLEKFAIKPVEPQGKMFDPTLHEAMATRDSDAASGTVLEVLQKGYLLNDRLLRPALVVVAKSA